MIIRERNIVSEQSLTREIPFQIDYVYHFAGQECQKRNSKRKLKQKEQTEKERWKQGKNDQKNIHCRVENERVK